MIDLKTRTSKLSKALINSGTLEDQTAIELNRIPTEWNNGTGYFDGAIEGIQVDAGSIAYGITENDRLIVIVGTHLGNIVLFERYSGGDLDVVCHNSADAIGDLIYVEGNISEEMLEFILGRVCLANIGKRLLTATNT